MDLPIIGDPLKKSDEKEVNKAIKYLKKAGMVVKKIINYRDGSIKYIAGYDSGTTQYDVRKVLEQDGWKVGAPYYSHGAILGFRVSKEGPAGESNVWGGA